MRNKWVEEMAAKKRQDILATPRQGLVQIFGRIAVVTQKVHVGKPEEDATFYFVDDPEKKRYHLSDLEVLAQEVFESLGTPQGRWYVNIPGTLRGKWRNKKQYERARLAGSVAENIAKASREKPRVNRVRVLTADGVKEIEVKEGPQRISVERLRKMLRGI